MPVRIITTRPPAESPPWAAGRRVGSTRLERTASSWKDDNQPAIDWPARWTTDVDPVEKISGPAVRATQPLGADRAGAEKADHPVAAGDRQSGESRADQPR